LQDTLSRVAERCDVLTRSGDPEAYARRVKYHRSVDWCWRRRRDTDESLAQLAEV
jgi:IS4 transposase